LKKYPAEVGQGCPTYELNVRRLLADCWSPDQQTFFVGEDTNPMDPRFWVLMTNSDEEQRVMSKAKVSRP